MYMCEKRTDSFYSHYIRFIRWIWQIILKILVFVLYRYDWYILRSTWCFSLRKSVIYYTNMTPHRNAVCSKAKLNKEKKGADLMIFNRKKVDAPVRSQTVISTHVWCLNIEWWHVRKLELLERKHHILSPCKISFN